MFTKSIIVAGLLAVSAPAFAGSDQLALNLGVAPGVYSDSQLAQLTNAYAQTDNQRVAFILANPAGDIASRAALTIDSGSTSGQLEANLGVQGAGFTINELAMLKAANDGNDRLTTNYILTGANRSMTTISDTGSVSPGKAQLAANLGVNPADYTTSELAMLLFPTDENNN